MAAYESLTTVAAVKAVLGITDTSFDTLLEVLLDRAEETLASMLGPRLGSVPRWESQSITEKVPGYWRESIRLKNFPVASISSVYLYTSSGNYTLLPSTSYRIDSDQRTLRFWGDRAALWQAGLITSDYTGFVYPTITNKAYPYLEIGYTGGYLSNANAPLDLAAAAIDLCKQMFLDRDRDYGLVSESLGNYSYTQGLDSAVLARIREQYLGDYLATPL